MPFRILLVDGSEEIRQAILAKFAQDSRFVVVGEASNGLLALKNANDLQPDLVVMDVDLPGLNGIEVARQLRYVAPDARVLFFTGNKSLEIARKAVVVGALGYLLKTHVADLVDAADAALRNMRFVSGRTAKF